METTKNLQLDDLNFELLVLSETMLKHFNVDKLCDGKNIVLTFKLHAPNINLTLVNT